MRSFPKLSGQVVPQDDRAPVLVVSADLNISLRQHKKYHYQRNASHAEERSISVLKRKLC